MELQLALYLSLSSLTDDKEIARFMDDKSTPLPLTTTITDTTAIKPPKGETIQHQDLFPNSSLDIDTNADITPSDTDLKPVDDIALPLSIPTSPYEPAPASPAHSLSDATNSLSSTLSLADEWTLLYTDTDTKTETDTRPHAQHQLDTNINNHTEAGPHSDNQTQLQPQTPLPLSPFSETETWILVEWRPYSRSPFLFYSSVFFCFCLSLSKEEVDEKERRKGKCEKEREKGRYRECIPENRESERGDISFFFSFLKWKWKGERTMAEQKRAEEKKKGDPVLYSLAFLRVSENEG
jgi:hypothetical protein